MNKQFILMRDVITKHHPAFTASADLVRYGMASPEMFNCERLIEESLAHVGGYEFVDQAGYDFTDYSDSKTTTVAEYDCVMAIGSVECKVGALRITIYNPHKQALDYMYMPYKAWKQLKECSYGKSEHKERLRVRWNARHDHYNSFEEFRLDSFSDMARQ